MGDHDSTGHRLWAAMRRPLAGKAPNIAMAVNIGRDGVVTVASSHGDGPAEEAAEGPAPDDGEHPDG